MKKIYQGMDEIEFLRHIFLFKDLTDEQIRKFLTIARKVSFKKGDLIIREGEEGDTMYIILEGSVEVSKTLTAKIGSIENIPQEKGITRMSAEDYTAFGEVALLEDRIRSASILCLTDCQFYEIHRKDFINLAENDLELGYKIVRNIAQILCTRLRKATEDIVKLSTALTIALSR
jgi:CRP-like cAMP-binding protein